MNKSFTILEVIIAIFVITIGVLGAFTVVQRIVSDTIVASSRLTAAYLAAEGIEIVRNTRDTNWLQGKTWNEGVSLGEETVGFLDGTTSKFKRKITIASEGDEKLKVFVEIQWQEKGQDYQINVQENLYDWK